MYQFGNRGIEPSLCLGKYVPCEQPHQSIASLEFLYYQGSDSGNLIFLFNGNHRHEKKAFDEDLDGRKPASGNEKNII